VVDPPDLGPQQRGDPPEAVLTVAHRQIDHLPTPCRAGYASASP
jgi:hypothetical protein